jgi:low temperature requirement protein LtrA
VSAQHSDREQGVASFELFFDLVFVFAFTQVTTLLTRSPTWSGLAHALLVLSALWWAWAAYAWLTNIANPEEGRIWGTMLVAMSAMFVAALAVPEAFGRHGVVFGVAFLIVALMQLLLYALSARGDHDLLKAILRVAPTTVAGATLIVVAGFAHGPLKPLLWLAALLTGLIAPIFIDVRGFRVNPAHLVERHGLIIIIAIGESLVAVGLGARTTSLRAGVIVAAILGLLVAASFWLAYFDFFTIRARRLLADRTGATRTALARDVYTYLHLPMVAGIVLFAFATETVIAHIDQELAPVAAFALCGGPALYLLAYVALRLRVARTIGGGRLVAAAACAALIPVALEVPALAALSLVAAVWIALHAYELIWWRAARAEVRASPATAAATPPAPAESRHGGRGAGRPGEEPL